MHDKTNPLLLKDIFIFNEMATYSSLDDMNLQEEVDMLSDTILSETKIKNLFGYNLWHLSSQNLGDHFTFTPRIPRNPLSDDDGNVTEDDFTKRISVAPGIKLALKALEGTISNSRTMYVYATNFKEIGNNFHDPDINDCSKNLGIKSPPKYGPKFRLAHWMDNIADPGELGDDAEKQEFEYSINRAIGGRMSPAQLPDVFMNKFKGCVPDSEETGELWITSPIIMDLLGVLWDEERATIKLTKAFVSGHKEKIDNLYIAREGKSTTTK